MNKNVFTYWETPVGELIPPYISLCIQSIERHCKEFHLITPENVSSYIDDNDLNPNWRKLPYIAQRADCIRVAVINKYGGFWVDADTVFIRSIDLLEEYIDDNKELCFLQWSDGRVLNGYFYAKEKSVIISKWLEYVNKQLSNTNMIQWTSFGESILTPLVLWQFKEKCQRLNREIFLPINFDRIPFVFFEDISYRSFVKHNTIGVGLNHSWLINVSPKIKHMMSSEILKGQEVLSQVLRDAYHGYLCTPYDTSLQTITRIYSYGSISVGDVDVLATMLSGLDTVVELGTNQGTTARLLSSYCKKVITVDVFEDLDCIIDEEWRDEYKKNFNNNPHNFNSISGYLSDCHNVEVVKSETSAFLDECDDSSIDAIFIDDDHSYIGVSRVYNISIRKVKIGGALLFHDCNTSHEDVYRFYNDVLLHDDRVEEIEYIPTTYYSSIKTFRRIK